MADYETAPFRFKQFTIEQRFASMKVGFDGVLLGAWSDVAHCQRILDVGTGTGLVALMLAQRTRTETRVHAVELDESAAIEATQNVASTGWNDRVTVIHDSFQSFSKSCPRYDLLVSNPPYFGRDVASRDPRRALARHGSSHLLEELIRTAPSLLTDAGRLCIIVPSTRLDAICELARRTGLYARRQLAVRPLPHKPAHRILLDFCRDSASVVRHEQLTIELRHHEYTAEFRELARDFYLAF